MKIKLIEHVPNFVDGYDPRIENFESVLDMLSSDWLKEWTMEKLDGYPFRRFTRSDEDLLAEFGTVSHTKAWWVIGRVEPIEALDSFDSFEGDLGL